MVIDLTDSIEGHDEPVDPGRSGVVRQDGPDVGSKPMASTAARREFAFRLTCFEVIQGGCYADPYKKP